VAMSSATLPQTFQDLAFYWLVTYAQSHKAASSINRDKGILRNYLLPRFGQLMLNEFRAKEVEMWITNLVIEGAMSKKSANDVLIVLNKILNDAVRWEMLPSNQVSRVTKFSISERDFTFWKISEVKRFLGYFLVMKDPPRLFWFSAVAVYTGMRRGEIQALRWQDIDERAGLMTIKRSYCRVSKVFKEETKSKKNRHVPINATLSTILQHLRKLGSTGLVIPFVNPDCFRNEFRRLCKEARVPLIRFHDLRHTFASNFLMGGGNIYDLQKILGHSTVQVTERYAHLAPGHLSGKTEVLGF
ncbi:MAG: tyrosine-type recombinase/integrase, partial [Minisyncoccia bacterium]